MAKQDKKLTHAEFVLRAVDKLAGEGRKGIHVVFSGFNVAFREYFPGDDPRKVCEQLVTDKVIVVRPCKGGAIIYKPGDAPEGATDGLKKMGLDK